MPPLSAADRLSLGLQVDDVLALAQDLLSDHPRFEDYAPFRQVLLLMGAYLQSQPCQVLMAENPRAINWERIMQFMEFLLPLILSLLQAKARAAAA